MLTWTISKPFGLKTGLEILRRGCCFAKPKHLKLMSQARPQHLKAPTKIWALLDTVHKNALHWFADGWNFTSVNSQVHPFWNMAYLVLVATTSHCSLPPLGYDTFPAKSRGVEQCLCFQSTGTAVLQQTLFLLIPIWIQVRTRWNLALSKLGQIA